MQFLLEFHQKMHDFYQKFTSKGLKTDQKKSKKKNGTPRFAAFRSVNSQARLNRVCQKASASSPCDSIDLTSWPSIIT